MPPAARPRQLFPGDQALTVARTRMRAYATVPDLRPSNPADLASLPRGGTGVVFPDGDGAYQPAPGADLHRVRDQAAHSQQLRATGLRREFLPLTAAIAAGARLGVLDRREDPTNCSGTGIVAFLLIFPDHQVAMRWNSTAASTSLWEHPHGILDVHGHADATRIACFTTTGDLEYAFIPEGTRP